LKYCAKCGVKVNTNGLKCPLCSMLLSEEEDGKLELHDDGNGPDAMKEIGAVDSSGAETADMEDAARYPSPEEGSGYRYNFVFRLLLFISIVAGSTCLLINLLTYTGNIWSFYVIGSLLYAWIVIGYPLFRKRKTGQIIVVVAIATSAYVFSLEWVTHTKGWALTYVLPFIFIGATLVITFIILIKRLKWREYTVYQTIMVILGFLPIIFCLTGLVNPMWPSILSAFYSLLTLVGMFIFADKKYKDELIKRFHI
jgi:cation transport ATPase